MNLGIARQIQDRSLHANIGIRDCLFCEGLTFCCNERIHFYRWWAQLMMLNSFFPHKLDQEANSLFMFFHLIALTHVACAYDHAIWLNSELKPQVASASRQSIMLATTLSCQSCKTVQTNKTPSKPIITQSVRRQEPCWHLYNHQSNEKSVFSNMTR